MRPSDEVDLDKTDVDGYVCPIRIVTEKMARELQKAQEDAVIQAVLNIGVTVDKEELVKALAYDRGQYEKGFRDGRMASQIRGEWKILEYGMWRDSYYAPYLVVECSNCGLSVRIEEGQYGWKYGDAFPWKCCPFCGAKMEGGVRNDGGAERGD